MLLERETWDFSSTVKFLELEFLASKVPGVPATFISGLLLSVTVGF